MARFAKKIGTLPARYMFEMTLHSVELNVPYDVEVGVVLKRGKSLEPTLKWQNSIVSINKNLCVRSKTIGIKGITKNWKRLACC
jgi:hypothetical protein